MYMSHLFDICSTLPLRDLDLGTPSLLLHFDWLDVESEVTLIYGFAISSNIFSYKV